MDPATTERLQKLQMADLGTARREHISTADSAKFNKLRLEDIEATRLSNQVGSRAQRMAQANKEKLAGWTNVHKTIGDTEDLEELDNLLNGQSHRAHLSASIRRMDEPVKSSRGARSSGRGGGVVGTRGRRVSPYPPVTAANSVPIPPDRKRSKDPALVPEVQKKNNETRSRGTKVSSTRKHSFSNGKTPPDFLKSRRPITGNFSRMISPPENFMAAARQMMQIQRIIREAPAPKTQSSITDSETVQSQKTVTKEPMSKTLSPKVTLELEPMQNRKVVDVDKLESSITTDLTCKKEDVVKKGTQMSIGNESMLTQNRREGPKAKDAPKATDASKALGAPKVNDAQAKDDKIENSSSKTMGLGYPEGQERTVYQSKHEQNQPQTPMKNALAPKQITPKNKPSIETDILLDFSATPPRESSLQEDVAVLTSPALQDLKGLQFQDNLFERGALSPGNRELFNSTFAPPNRLGCQNAETETLNAADTQGSTPVAHPNPPDNHQRDIELLCKLMESASLSNEHREKLKEIEVALQKSQEPTPVKRKTSALKVPQTLLPETKRETLENLPGSRSSSVAQTPVTTGTARPTPGLTSSPSPQSHWNIKAPPFVPRDVSNYRSPPDSSSSDSTGSLTSPGQLVQPTLVDVDHIIGDHLLPGRKGSHGALGSVPMNESTSAAPDKSSVKFDMPKAPQSTRVLPLSNPFSPQPIESLKHPIEFSIPQVLPRPTEHATPLRVPKSRAVRITDPNGNDLSESIYAPKLPKSNPTVRAPSSAAPSAAVRITDPKNNNITSQQTHEPKPVEFRPTFGAPSSVVPNAAVRTTNPKSTTTSQPVQPPKPAGTQPKATVRPVASGLEGSIYATSTSRRPLR